MGFNPILTESVNEILRWGARDGAVVRALTSHQCGPGSNPGVDAICGLSLLLVLSFALRGFSSWYSSFPLSSKTNISKFQFDQESGRPRTILWMCYLQIIIIIIIIILNFKKHSLLNSSQIEN